jgi:hypothetical protein
MTFGEIVFLQTFGAGASYQHHGVNLTRP